MHERTGSRTNKRVDAVRPRVNPQGAQAERVVHPVDAMLWHRPQQRRAVAAQRHRRMGIYPAPGGWVSG